jgi:hypothetical protein
MISGSSITVIHYACPKTKVLLSISTGRIIFRIEKPGVEDEMDDRELAALPAILQYLNAEWRPAHPGPFSLHVLHF